MPCRAVFFICIRESLPFSSWTQLLPQHMTVQIKYKLDFSYSFGHVCIWHRLTTLYHLESRADTKLHSWVNVLKTARYLPSVLPANLTVFTDIVWCLDLRIPLWYAVGLPSTLFCSLYSINRDQTEGHGGTWKTEAGGLPQLKCFKAAMKKAQTILS